jgi:glutathione S-transferase
LVFFWLNVKFDQLIPKRIINLKIYGDSQSGNCYKVQLTCALLNIEYQWQPIDILNGDNTTASFLSKSNSGKIPLLELDDGRCLVESNAIINYLANGSHLLPNEPFVLAKVQQWQFFEQYSHEPYIAVARFIEKYLGLPENRRAEYESKQEGGYKALKIMDQQLQKSHYLAGEQFTTADIALFAYTHVANEGGFDLSQFSAINAWLGRVQMQDNFIAMATSNKK